MKVIFKTERNKEKLKRKQAEINKVAQLFKKRVSHIHNIWRSRSNRWKRRYRGMIQQTFQKFEKEYRMSLEEIEKRYK